MINGEDKFWKYLNKDGISSPGNNRNAASGNNEYSTVSIGIPGEDKFWDKLGLKKPSTSADEQFRQEKNERILADHRKDSPVYNANDWLNRYNKLLDDVNEYGFTQKNVDAFDSIRMEYDRVSSLFNQDARKQFQDSFASIKDYFGSFSKVYGIHPKNNGKTSSKVMSEMEAAEIEYSSALAAVETASRRLYDAEDEDYDSAIEEYNAAMERFKRAESLQGELKLARNMAEREEKVTSYDKYRQEADFTSVSDQAKNAGYDRKTDPLGYYLAHQQEDEIHSALSGTADNSWSRLNDDEKQMYYYLLGSQGTKAAKQYLDDIQIVLDKRIYDTAQEMVTETYQNANAAGKVGLNVLTVPANVFGSITAPVGDSVSILSGKGYNPYNQGHSLTDFSNTVRGATSQDIIDSIGEDNQFWGQIASNTYQAVMSGADSALGATLFGNGYTTVMGSGAASQRARELWESGASDVQIGMGAIASGLIEMATEKYSVEYFTQNFLEGDIAGFKDWMTKTLIQGFNEGSEEVASEIANMAANAMILGANSDNQQEIRELMDKEGMSYADAEKQAYMNRVMDILWAGYGGFVSGGAMGGIGGAVNAVQQRMDTNSGSETTEDNIKLTSTQKDNLPTSQESKDLTSISESGFTVGTDSEHGTTVISFEEVPPKEIQDALKDNGFKFSSKNKVWFGQQSQEDARRIVLEAGGELYRKSEQLNSALPVAQDDSADTVADESITGNSERIATKKAGNDSISKPFVASEEPGITLLNMPDGSTVETEITGIASNEPGKLMLNVSGEDRPVLASDISYADSGEASLFYYVNEMELMPEAANMIVEQAKNDVSGMDGSARAEKMAQFSQSIYGMYSLGKLGIPQGKAMGSQFAGQLSESMAEVGYQLGRRIYLQNVQTKEATKQQRAASQRARAVTGGKKINGVQYDGLNVRTGEDGSVEIDGVTLNEQQKAGIQAAEMLASMGLNVHVFQSKTDANGKPIGENGSYYMADGSIHIDLNAGNDGQGVMAYTIAHELTHFMEDQQPEQFRIFTDALFEGLETDIEAEIANKAEKLKRQHPKVYQNASQDKLMNDARSEVVAEACETMLTDTDAAKRIAQQIQQQDATLWERIVQWFKDLSQKLRDAYEGFNPDSQIARDAKKTIQQLDGLVQMWADMAVDAAENYGNADAINEAIQHMNDDEIENLHIDDILQSARVTDEETLKFLNNQEYITTYRSMQLINGHLYPPMATVIGGKMEDGSELGVWEMATEHPELIKFDKGKPMFVLKKGTRKGDVPAAYNPYMHSSNVVLNDQFSSAYDRPNLVTVECKVPASENTSGYHAEYAKDSTGWHDWKTGPVATKLRKQKGITRQVFLSRWIMPVRILSDSEVANKYSELLGGTDIEVPDNVVTPGLLAELRKVGVPIKESGKVKDTAITSGTDDERRYSVRETDDGRMVAVVDNDILSNIDTTTWDDSKIKAAKKAASTALAKFSGGISVDGITRKVNKISRREYTRSNYTESLAKRDKAEFADKMRLSDVADDVVTVTTGWQKAGGLLHQRKDNFVDFDHGHALLMAGKNKYDAVVVVGIKDDGEYVFYDVVDIAPATFEIKKEEPSTTATTGNPIGDIHEDSSESMVAQDDGTVKHTDRDSEGKKLTEGQLAYFQNSKIRDEEGNLMVMYRGGHDEFTVFDRKKSSPNNLYGRGFYFTNSESNAKIYGNAKPFYLNITHPLMHGQKSITRQQMRNFIQAVADNEDDYGLDNYGYGATVRSVLKDVWGKGDYEMIWDLNQTAIGDMVAAVELFNEVNGTDYDGLVMPTETVTFRSNQAKSTDNQNPTADPDIRFSMRDSVEETNDLVAVHNLSEDKLMKSLKLGGLPMPSIAIVKAKDGHGKFGEISLVFGKETIDPEIMRSNHVYSGDAWTPTYPRVEYKPNEKVLSSIKKRINELVPYEVRRELGNVSLDTDNAAEFLNRYSGSIWQAFKSNDSMKYAYLKDSGVEISLPMKEDDLYQYGEVSNEAVRYFSGKLSNGLQSIDSFQNMSAKELLQEDGLKEAVADALNFDVLRTIEPGTEEYISYEKNPVFTSDNVSFRDIDQMLSSARTLLNYGVQKTIDRQASRKLISDSIDQADYEKWLQELFTNVVEKEGIRNNKDYFTPSGNRRSFEALHYENNLENVIKAMKESGEKGIGSFGTGSIFGASTTEFGSIDDIKKAEGRLVQLSQEEFDSIRDGFSDRFFELVSSLPINRNSFSASDDAANMLIEAVAKYKTKSGMDSYLRRESKGWANYSQYVLDDLLELVRDIRQMPTEYFEAKPRRAVGFDEVSAAVIPDNSSEELKSMLDERGISYVEYRSGDDQSRTDALNSIDGVLFSQRYSEESKLQRKNEKLQEDVSNLKELLRLQGTITGGKMFKPESIRTAANFIMRETGRILDDSQKVQLEDMLRETYGVLSDENVTYDNIVEECTKVAQWLDENGKTEDALDEYASGILSEMKGTPIQLDETQKQEARSLFGSLSEFRSRIAGTYKLSADGIPLDDIWNGLAIEYPMYFDADASSAGLPGLLVEAIDRLRNTRNTDPYQHMDVDQMMVKVYDGFWKAKKLTTVADRYQKKIDALNQKHEEAMQKISKLKSDQKAAKLSHQQELRETRQRMKQEASEEIAQITKKYQDQRSASVENRNRTKVRNQIFGLAEKFQKMATAPAKANTAHAPVGLVHSVARFCEIFADSEARAVEYAANRLSAKETEMELMNDLRGPTKTRLKEADAINRQRERLFKQAKAIAEIQERYRRIKDDSALSMFYDPHVETLVSQLQEQLRDRDIYDMTAKELNSVYDTMNAMMYTITNANRVFSMEKDKTLVGVVKKFGGEISENKVSHGAIIDAARKYNMWQMSPDTFFNFICGFKNGNEGIAVQKMFSDGSARMLGVQREFYRMFRNITEAQDSGKKKYFNQMMKNPMKEMVDWGLKDSAGNTVKTTRDIMLQAYMLLCQEDSFKSIVFGGFKLPDQSRYYKGKIDSAYSSADESALLSSGINGEYGDLLHEIRIRQEQIDGGGLEVETVNQLNREITALQDQAMELVEGATARTIKLRDSIEKLLTNYDREAIDTAKKWYKYTGQLMTDVYLQMYGYIPNLVEDYVPIHRDLSTVKTDIRVGEEGNAFNIENSGFTKDRVNSRAPILLTGFFNELGSQQQRISMYYGFAQVQKDFNRIWNMKVPGSQYTIKGKIAAKYGAGKTILGVSGEQYIEHYIQNVAGVRGGDDILSVLYGNAASATLSLNPRVALSQAASVPTAAAVVGWKSMANGFGKGLSTSFSKNKRNQLADDSVWFFQRYRGAGGITEIADMKAKGGIWSRVANSKVGKFLFNWCQNMDVFATASMWAMAEDYVKSNGMNATDDGYQTAVEQCYADIIRKSQPNYTVTERSDLLRDSRGGMKLLTMYKTQSNQNFNILVNAIGEYRAAVLANKSEKSAQSADDLKKARKNLANGITSVTIGGTLSFVLLRALVNFAWAKVKPYKDDDTDELEEDDFFLALAKEIGSSFAGMFALGGELYDFVYSCISGEKYYGISDSAISTISSIFESTSNLIQKATDENKNLSWNDVNKVFSSTLTGLGFPYKNASSFVDAAKQWYRNLETGTFFQYSDDTTTRQYRGRILKAWNNGDMEKIDDTLAILASKSSKDTDEAVNKDVTHGFANDFLKDQVKKGNIDAYEAVKLLRYIGHDDPDGVVAKWKFQDENPNVENPSSSLVSAYNNRGDIPGDVVIAAYKFKNNSNKEETVKYIQGLELSASQKKKLWNLIKGTWKDKDTPWS